MLLLSVSQLCHLSINNSHTTHIDHGLPVSMLFAL